MACVRYAGCSRLVGVLALLASSCTPTSTGDTEQSRICAFPNPPTILVEEGNAHATGSLLLQRWTVADDPSLWAQGAPPGIEALRGELERSGVETDPSVLLRQSDTQNNRLVAQNFEAWVRPIRCVEALVLDTQNARMPLAAGSTEFAAFFLRSTAGDQLRIYSLTRNSDGVGNLTLITDAIAEDIRQGWTLEAGLHNHNFHPEPKRNGIVAPSGPDAHANIQLLNQYGLQEAWITNGVHTVRIPSAAFSQFSPAG